MALYFSFPLLCSSGLFAARAVNSGRSFNIFFYVIFVIAFIYFTYFFTKTVGARLTGVVKGGSRNMVKLVETTMLGPERRVSIIEVAGIHYIVYADRTGATLLDKRTDLADAVSTLQENQAAPPFVNLTTDLSFKKTFDYILKKNRDEND